jgi:hypothetical protein
MHSFKDTQDRTWSVEINVSAVKRVRGLLKIDLYRVVDDGFKGLSEIIGDPVQLVDLVYVLCKSEADQRQVSDEDFGRSMGGDALLAAADAFVEELVDFFPEPRARSALRKVIETGRQLKDRLIDRAEVQINDLDPQREAETLIASWTASQASSASTPAP